MVVLVQPFKNLGPTQTTVFKITLANNRKRTELRAGILFLSTKKKQEKNTLPPPTRKFQECYLLWARAESGTTDDCMI